MNIKKYEVLENTIETISEYHNFIYRAENGSYDRNLLERYLLQGQYPQAKTYNEAVRCLGKDLPVQITIDKNKTFNNGRIIIKKI